MLLAATAFASPAQEPDFLRAEQRTEDFAAFCRFVEEEYAYFDLKATDWRRACAFHGARAADAADRNAFVELLERALGELYDPHAHLGTHTPKSYRLVPTHAEVLAGWSNGRALLLEVRRGSGAEAAGLVPGMEVVAIDGEAVEAAVGRIEPRFLSRADPAARDWALQRALAGRRDRSPTRLSIRTGDVMREVEFVPGRPEPAALLSHRVIGEVGYVRIHNSLGEQALVQAFDEALAAMPSVRSWVIDLRDTPSGGNSLVARGILGRFVPDLRPYQRHELVAEFRSAGIRRVWVEYVAPRGSPFLQPVVALVGRWTGSMGEGLAIGLNATRGAPVLGPPMARLLGANGETVLPHSKIVVRVPVEKLFHVDGTAREAFVPCPTPPRGRASPGDDTDLAHAVSVASRMARRRNEVSSSRC